MTELKFAELGMVVRAFGNAYIRESGGLIDWQNGWELRLQNYYERSKDKLKKEYTQNPSDVLDRHKVGAVMMNAIIHTEPLTPTGSAKLLPPRLSRINYRMAFLIGILIFRRYAGQDAIDAGDEAALKMHTAPFNQPLPINRDGTYEDQTVRALYEAHSNNKLDIFLLANILYLLDVYHRATFNQPPPEPVQSSVA